MISKTKAILNILCSTGGRYVGVNSSPRICTDFVVLSDGKVCPIGARESSIRCFSLESNFLKLSELPDGFELTNQDNILSEVARINRRGSLKISQVGQINESQYQLQNV